MKSSPMGIKLFRALILTLAWALHAHADCTHPDEAPINIIVKSPPITYGNTVDLGTFHYDDKEIWIGVAFENTGKETLEWDKDRTTCSLPFKCTVRLDKVVPTMKVGVWAFPKFKKPVGKFKAKMEVYWKGYKSPTVYYITGNCIK